MSSCVTGSSLVLRCADTSVARYVIQPGLAPRLAPRPYLHPVSTLGGTLVTELSPADHAHHLGVGIAVPDVEGHNFWGGRTFVRGQGPTERDNHGTQHHQDFERTGPDGFVADLRWVTAGRALLRERRTVAATLLEPSGSETSGSPAWALDLTFALTNTSGGPLSIGSPATNGRPGAGYGGFFWRAPKEAAAPAVFTADADGESAVHGTVAPWLALAGESWTLVFAGATERTRRDPWFVRAAEYPGVGSSLAYDARLPLTAGDTLVRRVVTVVADGRLDRDQAAALAAKATEAAKAVDG